MLTPKPNFRAERQAKKAARAEKRYAAMVEAIEMDNVTCQACGQNSGVSPHHIIYRSQGGPDETWNLITLCEIKHDWRDAERPCHKKAHQGRDNGSRQTAREWMIALLEGLRDKPAFWWGRALEELRRKV